MVDDDGRVSHQRDLLLPGILVLRQYFLLFLLLLGILVLFRFRFFVVIGALRLLKPVVCFLEERYVVIECLHVEVTIDIQLSVVGNGISQVRAILQIRTTYPVIR